MVLASEDLNLLVALGALLEERHVTRAGDRLGLTQSSMSGQLRRLRARFDDGLLVRTGNVQLLTPVAEALLPLAQDALLTAERVFARGGGFDPATSTRRFRVAMSDYAQVCLAPTLVQVLREDAPHVKLDLEPLPPAIDLDFDRWLLQYDALVLPGQFANTKRSGSEPLFTDGFACVLDRGNPEVQDGRVSIESLRRLPYLSTAAFTGSASTVALAEAAMRGEFRDAFEPVMTVSVTVAAQVLPGSPMWSLIPRRLVRALCETAWLVAVDPPFPTSAFTEAAHWHPGRTTNAGIAWLRNALLQAATRSGAP